MTRRLGPRRAVPGIGRASTVAVLLVIATTVFGVGAEGPTPVRADGLASRIAAARARQADIQRSVERQKQLLGQLQQDEGVAKTALTSTANQLDQINTDQAAVRKEIADATDALHRVQSRRDALVEDLRQLDWTLGLLQSQIDQGAQDLQTRRRALGQRLAEAYRSQQTSLLEQVLSSGSFTDVVSNASAYLAYGDQDLSFAQGIATDQAALDSLRVLTVSTRYRTDQLRRQMQQSALDLQAQQNRLDVARQRLAALETKVKAIQDQQIAAFKRINDTQAKVDRALAQQAAAEARLRNKIAGLVRVAQRRAAARERAAQQAQQGSGNGLFSWPTSGIVTQEFGCTGFYLEPPLGSCAHFHDGIDIANAEGTPVRAARSGVVAYVGWNPFQTDPAFIVEIGHSGGYTSGYAHLMPRYVVRAGQYVHRGQLIGYMGNTGNSTGTHLHWEIYRGNVPIDPRSLL